MSHRGAAPRANLVIVRAGRSSLHNRWLRDGESRSWDLLVSAYDSAPVESPGVTVSFQRGGKWDGLYEVLADSDLLDRYEYVWLPDDDIDATAADIDEIFALMRRYGLVVGQPALTPDSYYSHFITNACPGLVLRHTNFVEIMVPCLKASHLRQILREFKGSMSGYGLDYLWCRVGEAGPGRAAILDCVTVRHTRPVGRVLQGEMGRAGIVPEAEEAALKNRYGIRRRIVPIAYSAVDSAGRRIEGRRRLALRMAAGYVSALPHFSDRLRALRKIGQMLRRQYTKHFDLSSLARRPDDPFVSPLPEAQSCRHG